MRRRTLPAQLVVCLTLGLAAALCAAPPAAAKGRSAGSGGKSHAHGGSATHHRHSRISGAVVTSAYPRYPYAYPYGSDCLRRDEAGNCLEWRGASGALRPAPVPRYIEQPSSSNP